MSATGNTLESRFEDNLGWYLGGILKAAKIKHQVLLSASFEEAVPPVVLEIDACSDVKDEGFYVDVGVTLKVSGQVNDVKKWRHRQIVDLVWASLFCTPMRLESRTLRGSPQALRALNFTPGTLDARPAASVLVRDLMGPSRSMAGNDATATSVIMFRTTLQDRDWDGDGPYGQ